MRACYSIFKIKTAEGFQYRIAGLAGASISIFYSLIEITVYSVFYLYANHSNAGILAGLNLKQMVSYIWLAQVLFTIQMNIDSEILRKIESGDIGIELCRPLDLYAHWFAKNAAGRITPLFWRGSITLLASMLMPAAYRLSPPVTIANLVFMLLSVISAMILCTAFATFVCTVRLNITWGNGPTYMIMLIGGFLSGSYLPLQLWPDFLQGFLFIQPFAGYLDIPLRFYLGSISLSRGIFAIGMQLSWAVFFIIAGKILMSYRLKTIIVQGG